MSDNPSIQCSVCGKWMRYTGVKNGEHIYRFFSVCGKNGQIEHEKPVCNKCCQNCCPYDKNRGFTWKFYESKKADWWKGKKGIVLRDLRNKGGVLIEKGTIVVLTKRHRGLHIEDYINKQKSIIGVNPSDIYLIH